MYLGGSLPVTDTGNGGEGWQAAERTDSWEAGTDPKGRSGCPAVCGLEALFYLVKAGLIPEEWGGGSFRLEVSGPLSKIRCAQDLGLSGEGLGMLRYYINSCINYSMLSNSIGFFGRASALHTEYLPKAEYM